MTLTSRFGLRAIGFGILGAAALVACQGQVAVAAEPSPPPPPSGSWSNVTGNVGGETWGPGGVGLLACVPGADVVIAGVNGTGLWSSADGGKMWKSLAKGLPVKISPITGLAILDAKTYLVRANGTTMGYTSGLFRSEDSGQTWKKVNAAGAVGRPLVASTGMVYWHLEGEGLSASGNKGWSWSPVKGQAQRTPIEAAGQRLISVDKAQLYGSPDRGASWVVCALPAPYTPTSIAYSSQRNCFYICRSTDKKSSEAIARFDLGQNLESVIPEKKAAIPNREDATTGRALAWTGPADFTALASWAKFRGLDPRPATTGRP